MRDQVSGTVIRVDPKTRIVIATSACVITGVIVVGGVLSLTGFIHNQNPPSTLLGIMSVGIAGGGALIFSVFRSRVVLYPDGIEVSRNLSPSLLVTRSDIVARYVVPSGWRRAPYHVLITRHRREVKLPPYLENNKAFRNWMSTIPLRFRGRSRRGE